MQYNLGMVTVLNGYNLVTANQNQFAMNWAGVKAGDRFTVKNSDVWYVIAAVPYLIVVSGISYYQLALSSNYMGPDNTAAGYAIHEGFSPNFGFPTMKYGDTSTPAIFTLAILGIDTVLGEMIPRITAIPFSATITPPQFLSRHHILNIGTLTGNITVAAPYSGVVIDGAQITFRFSQDATGSRTTSWNAAYVFGTDVTAAMIPGTANATYEITFRYAALVSKWRAIDIKRGF